MQSPEKILLRRPTLSVVMCNYNHARFLPDALQSVLDQSYAPTEVILIDDGSTDGSMDIMEDFAKRFPIIRVFSNDRNRGFIFSANRGLEIASGEYVCLPSADDRELPGLFEKSMNLLAEYPQAGLCSTLSAFMNAEGEHGGIVRTPVVSRTPRFFPPDEALTLLRRHGTWFMGSTVIYRRAPLMEAGGAIPELGPYSDTFVNQVLTLTYGACFIPQPLGAWRKMRGTWSETTSGDIQRMMAITECAERLMRSTHRGVFPSDYVQTWRRRQFYELGTAFVGSNQGAHLAGLRSLLGARRVADRMFLGCLGFGMAVERFLTKTYLFSRYRRSHLWQELWRRLRHVAIRETVRDL